MVLEVLLRVQRQRLHRRSPVWMEMAKPRKRWWKSCWGSMPRSVRLWSNGLFLFLITIFFSILLPLLTYFLFVLLRLLIALAGASCKQLILKTKATTPAFSAALFNDGTGKEYILHYTVKSNKQNYEKTLTIFRCTIVRRWRMILVLLMREKFFGGGGWERCEGGMLHNKETAWCVWIASTGRKASKRWENDVEHRRVCESVYLRSL